VCQWEIYKYLKTHPLQQLAAAEVLPGIGGMECIELQHWCGYLHLQGSHNISGLNSMSNRIKELIKTYLNTQILY
jgi:hypothetical protein